MFLQTPEANEPPTVPVDPMTKREVALILSVNKPYDRKVVAGIDRFTRTHRSWTLYVEDEPLAKIPNLRRRRTRQSLAVGTFENHPGFCKPVEVGYFTDSVSLGG